MGDAAQVLYQSAQHDSETRTSGVPQRYSVLAYRHEDSREPEASYPFVIKTNTARALIGGDTEPPTDKGVLSHYMRHDENLHRIMVNSTESMLIRLNSEVEFERKRRMLAEQTSLQLTEKTQELLDRSSERRINEARAVQHDKHVSELMGVVVAMLPMLAAKLLGIGDPKGETSQLSGATRDIAVRKMLKNLSSEETTKLVKSLEPHNQLVFFELYKSFREDELKEQAQRPEILRDGEEKAPQEAREEDTEKVH